MPRDRGSGHRHGHRPRSLTGTFGRIEIAVPRARLDGPDGNPTEWKSKTLRAYQRRLAADALIASSYLAGINARRVCCALKALFGGAVNKDTVSRVWRKLAEEPTMRLILDGTLVRVRLCAARKTMPESLVEFGREVSLSIGNYPASLTLIASPISLKVDSQRVGL
jgi:transposase-like protein